MADYDIKAIEDALKGIATKEAGDFNFLDYDTVKQGEVAMRILGLDAPEVQNFTRDGVTNEDPFGAELGNLAATLAKEMGATRIQDSGKKDKYNRPLVNLRNENNEDFTDKSYYEGILQPDTFTSKRHNKLARDGRNDRVWNKDKPRDPNDAWAAGRVYMQDLYRQQNKVNEINDINPLKQNAFNEKEWAENDKAFGGYNQFKTGGVDFHTPGARYDNTAYSPFKTAFGGGVKSMKAGWQGALASWNDLLGDEDNWTYRTSKAKELERQQSEMPSYISNVSDIENWRDTGEYIAGLGGMMSPYLLAIAGSAAAASVLVPTATIASVAGATAAGATTLAVGSLPMSLIYGGQTYNDMEGTMDQKNAGLALTSGIIMASLDRLGLKGLMTAAQTIKNGSHEIIAKAYMKKENIGVSKKKAMTIEQARLEVQKAFSKDGSLATLGLVGMVDLPMVRNLIIKQGGADFFAGATREGGTELLQEMTQYGAAILGSEKEWESTEAGDRALNALIGGSLMGGIISPVISTPMAINQNRILNSKFQVAEDQPNFDQAEANNVNWYDKTINAAKQGIANPNRSSGPALPIVPAVTQEETDNINQDIDQHRNIDNKLKNKGLFQWVQDIGKNFISRPLEWYWKSDMHAAIGDNIAVQSVLSLFAATNKDVISGEAIQDIENKLYNKFSNLTLNTVTRIRSYIGDTNSKKGRIRMQKVISNIYNAEKLRKRKKLNSEEKLNLKNLDDSLTLDQQKELIATVDDIAANLNADILELTGEDIGLTGQQLLLNMRPDRKLVSKNKSRVRELLMKNSMTGKEADRVINNLIDAPENSSAAQAEDSKQRLSINDVTTDSLKPSRLGDANPFNAPGMEEFASTDLLSGMESTARELIHNALVSHYIGAKGINLKRALALIKRQSENNWDKKFAADVISSAEIWMGVYKPIQNKKLKELQANITSFNLLTLLGTSGPAQLPELFAAFLGRVSESEGGRPLIADLKKISGVVAKHYSTSASLISAQYFNAGGMSYTDAWTPNRLRFGAAGYGGVKYGAIGQQGINAEEIKSSRLRSSLSSAFITISLIKPLTDISRIGADFIANDAMFHHMDVLDAYLDAQFDKNGDIQTETIQPMSVYVKNSYDMMSETRIPPLRTLVLWKRMKIAVNKKFRNVDFSNPENFAAIEREIADNHSELNKLMDVGRKQWVDNSLANPGPATKSRVSNDPHYALLFQFRGYILTFAASIVPRLVKRAISKNPNVDVNAITTMAGLVAMGFLGQALKDEWKTEGRPYWIDDAEFVQRGIQASGMLGPFDFLLDAVNPIYGEASVWNSMEGLMGPTWGNVKQFSKVGKNTIAGESDAAIEAALKMIPIFGAKQEFRNDPIGTILNPILGDK